MVADEIGWIQIPDVFHVKTGFEIEVGINW
jgi:hypothetical protein